MVINMAQKHKFAICTPNQMIHESALKFNHLMIRDLLSEVPIWI